MWFPLPLKKRIPWDRMVFGGLMITLSSGVHIVRADPGLEARQEREKLAASVMTTSTALEPVTEAQQAEEKAVFEESVKRLQGVEKTQPRRALEEYRRFLVGKRPVPAVGIQAALKVSELRENIKDVNGALMTCDLFSQKYGSDPASTALVIRKAEILVRQGRRVQAWGYLKKMFPRLINAGPTQYSTITEFLLKMAQTDLDGQVEGKEQRAKTIYVNVEEIYFRWLKSGTVPHTWQLFEALQGKYEGICEARLAEQLLPKVADALLQMTPSTTNPEGADISVMAARWLSRRDRFDEALKLYAKVPAYGNAFVSEVSALDQVKELCERGNVQAAAQIAQPLLEQANNPDKVRVLSFIAYGDYVNGNFGQAIENSSRVLVEAKNYALSEMEVSQGSAQATLDWAKKWTEQPLLSEPAELTISPEEAKSSETIVKRLLIFSHQDLPIEASCDQEGTKVFVGDSGGTNQYTSSRQVSVLFDPHKLPAGPITIKVHSSKYPNFNLNVPVSRGTIN